MTRGEGHGAESALMSPSAGLHDVTVPVMVDSVKQNTDFLMTRCIYFVIEAGEVDEAWELSLARLHVPFFMLGMSGVIFRPHDEAGPFRSADQLDELLDRIEANDRLVVETADIWLPTTVLSDAKAKPARGDVFRVGGLLFHRAYQFRSERVGREEFVAGARDSVEQVQFSEGETEIIRVWFQRQVTEARERYQDMESKNLVLPWSPQQAKARVGMPRDRRLR